MFTMNCRGHIRVVDKPIVMAILNATPDSFYSGSCTLDPGQAVTIAGEWLRQGATILDIGGQSTRPGAQKISAADERERVLPLIESIHRAYPEAWISIDTYYASVAADAVAAGATLVNDVSGGLLDPAMLATVARLKVPYVCMHIKGTPEHMQQNPQYEDVTQEVLDVLIARVSACRQAGIQDIIIDPGFGFGKTAAHNFTLLKNLSVFSILGLPLLCGLSRKSTVYRTLGTTPEEALNGTTVLHTIALLNGAHILRVHDVREAVEAVKLVEAYREAGGIIR